MEKRYLIKNKRGLTVHLELETGDVGKGVEHYGLRPDETFEVAESQLTPAIKKLAKKNKHRPAAVELIELEEVLAPAERRDTVMEVPVVKEEKADTPTVTEFDLELERLLKEKSKSELRELVKLLELEIPVDQSKGDLILDMLVHSEMVMEVLKSDDKEE